MSGFRLYSLALDTKSIDTNEINLVDDSDSKYDNYFTLIVGNNGTGKSRILSRIANFFKDISRKDRENHSFNYSEFDYNFPPSKIIAITNSISDKFPMDQGFRNIKNSTLELYHRDFDYNYLGMRNKLNSFSSTALMNRALEIIFESYSQFDISRNYRHIFDYLDYEPVLRLEYKLNTSYFEDYHNGINPETLVAYAENYYEKKFFDRSESTINIVKERAYDLCNLINDSILSKNRINEIIINFSEKNINRISQDNSLYSEKTYEYDLISILRKVGIISTFRVQVYKKGGSSFNFREASSGEANILSTLISLVPLLKDNSLVLIDEPEISLHPLWQSKYIDLLNKILENVSGCHIIIASHSPFLASDLKPNNSSVVSLKNKKGVIYANGLEKSTYGWSAEDILLNVFDMETTRNFDLYQSVSKALLLLSDNKRSNEELKLIQNNLKSFYPSLLDNDPIKPVIEAIFKAISYD